uniref:Uncharacterized protein n=1 Tax=Anopheles quadriannulatus TaxID=34691 RepID=A0A182XR82_ANOQN
MVSSSMVRSGPAGPNVAVKMAVGTIYQRPVEVYPYDSGELGGAPTVVASVYQV